MQLLIESGRIADIILLLIVLEIVALALLSRVMRAPRLPDLLGTLLSGLFLVGALKSCVAGAPWTITAALLLAALAAHMFDLWRRWPSA